MELLLMLVIVFLACLFLSIRECYIDDVPIIPVNRKDCRKGKPRIVRSHPFPENILVIPKMLSEAEFEEVKKNLIKQYRQRKRGC